VRILDSRYGAACLGGLVALALCLAPRDAHAACTTPPSAKHICVAFDEVAEAYTVDTGGGAALKGALSMTIGETYTFEIDPADLTDFNNHPFYLSANAFGASLGMSLTGAIKSGTLTFSPTVMTPAKSYYQCADHVMMGGLIDVPGGAPPPPPVDAGPHPGHDAGPADASAPDAPDGATSDGGASDAAPSVPGAGDGPAGSAGSGGGCGIYASDGTPASGLLPVALAALVAAFARRRQARR
jgi:MYXO-CTERM domain-containing protein